MIEEIFKCKICDKYFKSKEALEMHNSTKHSEKKKGEQNKKPKINYKKIRNLTIIIAVFGLLFYGFYWTFSNMNSYIDLPAKEINIGGHQNIALHIHSELNILIDGEEFEIPANIGISEGIMRPLHTHDSTGEIHIEGPYRRDFTLGEFFDIWGKTLNQRCIFDYCTDKGELKMYINGNENQEFGNHILQDGEDILIEYNLNI